ncbi:MAG TPA: hypothetical protein VF599_12505 [Pyrinomonadaceae bacterium]|jgi:hypothetical protein
MSLTKSYYHEEICEMLQDADAEAEAQMAAYFEDADETEIDWFSDFKIDHTGYLEVICELCGEPSETGNCHRECHDREAFN